MGWERGGESREGKGSEGKEVERKMRSLMQRLD